MNATAMLPGRLLMVGDAESLAKTAAVVATQPWSQTVVHSPREALRLLREDRTIDMVVLVPGHALDAYTELCRIIKFDPRSGFTAVVVLLPEEHRDRGADIFEAGADDCVGSGASDREILLHLVKALRVKQATDSLEDSTTVITALASAIEGKDHYTCGHVERVGAYCVEIGRVVGVDPEGLVALKTGGIVHDIGKIGIPEPILNKPGKLTDDEMSIMQRHPVIGYEILKPLRTFRSVLPIVRWHHERPNGSGYPDGLKGEQLSLLPRIIAVADVFDALSTDRPYRVAFSLEKCRQIMVEAVARGELDQQLVAVLFNILDTGLKGAVAA